MNTKRIYIAATSQHIGKTTSTLGIVHALKQRGLNVGYCKPVGQQFVELGDLRVDKDALLFSRVMDFELVAENHSPVILGRGATSDYLMNPEAFNYRERIVQAAANLEAQHDIVVYEGTGHPGVGSVVDLSNADVAQLINSEVVLVVEGGVGNTIDRINLSLALFREKNISIRGIIINKVMPEKLEKVQNLVKLYLDKHNLPLLGVIPYDKSLAYPLLYTVRRVVDGEVLRNGHKLNNKIENIIDSSLVEIEEFVNYDHLLLVISSRRLPKAIRKIKEFQKANNLEKSPLTGIILTNHRFFDTECDDYITQNEIPVIHSNLDTYGAVIKISRIEVKINRKTPWKIQRAVELINEHVDIDKMINR
ncbi:MAG: dethiobiotin synthetase [Saprospiraceae bacterium]|jgi:dethiobiotin synthetase